MLTEAAIEVWITLQHIRGVGNITLRKLVEKMGGPEAVLEVTDWHEHSDWLHSRTISLLSVGPDYRAADDSLKMFQKLQDVWAISYWDKEYPDQLRDIANPPVILYGRGDISILQRPGIAVIGARRCSGYGQKVAREFAAGLAQSGINVISGLAMGIDATAHGAALDAGGVTTAIKGCGLGIWYPKHSREFLRKIHTNGLVLSEFPPGTPPEAKNFPIRNRIVSGLSRGVVVIEASKKSGTMITASYAMEQGREVMAVPGSIYAPTSSGVHWLIRQGATLVESVDDILFHVGLSTHGDSVKKDGVHPATPVDTLFSANKTIDGLTPEEKLVLDRLSSQPVHIDDLAALCGFSVADLSVILLQLELKDLVEAMPGSIYRSCS